MNANIKVGDTVERYFSYRGTEYPALVWKVNKINRKTYGVVADVPAGHPAEKCGTWFNLYMDKETGKIQ